MLVKENVRETWAWAPLDRVWQDIRYGWRGMTRNPAFTAVAVLSLALGIGANTAIFSLIDALMLRWLPVSNPQSLFQIKTEDSFDSLSYPAVRLLAAQKEIFDGVAGFSGSTFLVGEPGSLVKTPGAYVTGGFYQTLGLTASAGRFLTPEDDEPGGSGQSQRLI